MSELSDKIRELSSAWMRIYSDMFLGAPSDSPSGIVNRLMLDVEALAATSEFKCTVNATLPPVVEDET